MPGSVSDRIPSKTISTIMTQQSPFFSIITVVRNSQNTILGTLQSVRNQTHPSLEHIVIDGQSTDNTLEIIENNRWEGLKLLSEPDDGIADAMNKGISIAKGKWLIFINSDDHLMCQDTLQSVLPYLKDNIDIVGFPVMYGSLNTQLTLKAPRGANWYLNFKTGLLHQGTFIHRRVFEKIGTYDTSLKVTMDYELFLRAYREGVTFSFHASPAISVMGDDGISSQRDWKNLSIRFMEEKRIHLKHAHGILKICYSAYWPLYSLYWRIRHIF